MGGENGFFSRKGLGEDGIGDYSRDGVWGITNTDRAVFLGSF